MSGVALLVDTVTVEFGSFRAIDMLSLAIDFGEVRAVIGPNGAGKTTLLDVISGITRPKQGRVIFDDLTDIVRSSESAIARAGVRRKFQKPSIFEALSVENNLRLALRSKSRPLWKEIAYRPSPDDETLIIRVLDEIGMASSAQRPGGVLSHGEKQWLEIGMLLVQEPKILLLDEPVAGMTDEETERTAALVKRLKSPARAIVVIEHDMSFVSEIADVVTVLHEGKLLLEGPMAQVRADPRVIDVYLGR